MDSDPCVQQLCLRRIGNPTIESMRANSGFVEQWVLGHPCLSEITIASPWLPRHIDGPIMCFEGSFLPIVEGCARVSAWTVPKRPSAFSTSSPTSSAPAGTQSPSLYSIADRRWFWQLLPSSVSQDHQSATACMAPGVQLCPRFRLVSPWSHRPASGSAALPRFARTPRRHSRSARNRSGLRRSMPRMSQWLNLPRKHRLFERELQCWRLSRGRC